MDILVSVCVCFLRTLLPVLAISAAIVVVDNPDGLLFLHRDIYFSFILDTSHAPIDSAELVSGAHVHHRICAVAAWP